MSATILNAEQSLDDYIQGLSIPWDCRIIARWALATIAEDQARVLIYCREQNDPSFFNFTMQVGMIKEGLRLALTIVDARATMCAENTHPVPHRKYLDTRAYVLGCRFLAECAAYQSTARLAFSRYHTGKATCNISHDDSHLLVFRSKEAAHRYYALGVMLSLDDGASPISPIWRWLPETSKRPPVLEEIASLASMSATLEISYDFDPTLAVELSTYLPREMNVIPDSFSGVCGTGPELRAFLHALNTRCLYHCVAIILGSEVLGVPGGGIAAASLLTTKKELAHELAQLSALSCTQTGRLIEFMTYGYGLRTPDPTLQPFIKLVDEQLVVPVLLTASTRSDRNLLVLLSRVDPTSFSSSSHVFETRMIEGLSNALKKRDWTVKARVRIPGHPEAGDVDLLVVDPDSDQILAVELRWTLQPAEPRELERRVKLVHEKAKQLAKQLSCLRGALPQTLAQLGMGELSGTTGTWQIDGLVVFDGFEGRPAQGEAEECVIVHRRVLEAGIDACNSLADLRDWLTSYSWLPIEDEHYVRGTSKTRIGHYTLQCDGMRLLPQGERFAQRLHLDRRAYQASEECG